MACVKLIVIDTSGSPREIGRAHSEQARELVQQTLAGWREAMASTADRAVLAVGMDRSQIAVGRLLH